MAFQSNIKEFLQKAEMTKTFVVREWINRSAELGQWGMAKLVERTEDTEAVQTGAYSASHTIRQGPGAGRAKKIIFEGSNRVPDGRATPAFTGSRTFSPPDVGRVYEELRAVMELEDWEFRNTRSYSHDLEYGRQGRQARVIGKSASGKPRLIYEAAADAVASLAASLTVDPKWRVPIHLTDTK